jgi:hypothetical protein
MRAVLKAQINKTDRNDARGIALTLGLLQRSFLLVFLVIADASSRTSTPAAYLRGQPR